ncbi:MAG: glycerophosphodiester phosphodiesterase [Anaerolineae bacterium]|nr:glycerophosphodiester phosphodiesterase [Anaerolineae bacterium]
MMRYLETFYPHTPLVLAHRGAKHDAPENTAAAFTLARQMGADGVELDTSLTRDGVPVVIHDLTLDKTTDGHGLVRSYDLKTIKTLDAGSHLDPKFKGEPIPTLDEAFEAIGPDLIVNVELKVEPRQLGSDGLEQAALNVIRRHNAARRVIVSSFNPLALRRFAALAPDIPIGYLYEEHEPSFLRDGWLMLGARFEALHPHHPMIDAGFMRWAKARGYRVNTWTVDEPDRVRELRDLGVDAIISNRPDVALRALKA